MDTYYPDLGPYFDLREFVHPDIWAARGLNSIQHVSKFQIEFAKLLREKSGAPITLNTWHIPNIPANRRYVGRGTRPRSYRPKGGGELSQHYLAQALDPSSRELAVPKLYDVIMDNFEDFWNVGLRVIEDINITKTWLHGDSRLLWPTELNKMEKGRFFKIVLP